MLLEIFLSKFKISYIHHVSCCVRQNSIEGRVVEEGRYVDVMRRRRTTEDKNMMIDVVGWKREPRKKSTRRIKKEGRRRCVCI